MRVAKQSRQGIVGRERERLIAELRDIERLDAEYYRLRSRNRGEVNTYAIRQQRRRQILIELADEDIRRHSRLPLTIDVILFSFSNGMVQGTTSDISESGFAATLNVKLPEGELVRAEIHLPFGTKVMAAIVRNQNGFRHGFEFAATDLSEEMQDWMQ